MPRIYVRKLGRSKFIRNPRAYFAAVRRNKFKRGYRRRRRYY